jgi:DNA-binding GntR family transcriptional regulator
MARRGDAKSLAADVYARIRESIFNGTLRPGDRIQPAVLGERYNASTTVIREALALLAGERLVRSRTGHGFYIPELQRHELEDLTIVRQTVESLAVRLAVERGGVDWESTLMAAHHKLARTPRRTADNPNHTNQEWSKAHREFHHQLIVACDIPILLDLCQQLGSATELYRVWVGELTHGAKRDVEAEHAAVLEAVLANDPGKAAEVIATHYRGTADLILAHWPEGSDVAHVT